MPFNIFVSAGEVKAYTLKENGLYNISIYDWEDNWRANSPAFTEFIMVTKPDSKCNTNCYFNVCHFLNQLLINFFISM